MSTANKALKFTKTSGAAAATGITGLIDATLVSGGNILPTVHFIVIQVETQNVRWRDDGTDPTAAIGFLLAAGKTMIVHRPQFATFKLIEVAASTVVNACAYSGEGFQPLQLGN
jgi:hypothetical protein